MGESRYSDISTSFRIARRSVDNSRRLSSGSAEYRPCFKAFLFPFGAPGDVRAFGQRPFLIAGDLARAPHACSRPGLSDRVVDGLGLIGGILTVALVLLYISGAFGVGMEITSDDQPKMQAKTN